MNYHLNYLKCILLWYRVGKVYATNNKQPKFSQSIEIETIAPDVISQHTMGCAELVSISG